MSIFQTSTNDEDDVATGAKSSTFLPTYYSAAKQKKIEKQYEKVLKANATAFDYDGVYEEMQETKQNKVEQQSQARVEAQKKSKYIDVMMKKADIRERENDRIRERRLLKERQVEDELYGEKEKFVTSAYKQKLIQQQYWEDEDERMDAIEAAQDVTKRGVMAMGSFYQNLNTKNIAMGSNVETSALSKYTVGKSSTCDTKERKNENQNEKPRPSCSEREPKRSRTINRDDTNASAASPITTDTSEIHIQNVVNTTEETSKDDRILAAKARYLARKKDVASA